MKPQFKPGDRLTYNDGRPGHTNTPATVLAVGDNAMSVQFEDRADTTTIRYGDRAWMAYLTLASRG